MKDQKIRLGLLGLGNIGMAVYQLVAERFEDSLQVKRVLVRDVAKARPPCPAELLTSRPEDVLEADDIDMVVEFLGGVEPAGGYLLRALEAGKTVVTANKAALAGRWQALHQAARDSGAGLYYEAACCAGIPVVAALRCSLGANTIGSVAGIVNGTTNYILSQMDTLGLSYEAALQQAQALGLAEPDPTADVEGIDSANKLSILLSLAWGSHVPVDAIATRGIRQVERRDMDLGRDLGLSLKLVACGEWRGSGFGAAVAPAFVPQGSFLAKAQGGDNALSIVGDPVGQLLFGGSGAGQGTTASGVVGDICYAGSLERHQLPACRGMLRPKGDWPRKHYIRLQLANDPQIVTAITQKLETGGVIIDRSRQAGTGEGISLGIITQPIERGVLDQCLGGLPTQVGAVYPIYEV